MASGRHTRMPSLSKSFRRLGEKLVWSFVVLLLTLAPLDFVLFLADRAAAQEADPLPIQRIQIPPERVTAEMERIRRNVLTEMPRAQFEHLVRQAAQAEAAGKAPPRLVEAHYRAEFSDAGLTGTAQWKIVHDAEGPGRLSLGSLQLALRAARWSNRAPAVLGVLDNRPGSGLELLVEGKGERTLSLDWSARGLPEPGAVRFEIRLPNCAVTTLELDLPLDLRPQVDRDEAVLSGPLAADYPGRRRWRLSFPRSAGGGLAVRLSVLTPPTSSQPPPLLRSYTQTTQKLTPGQVECEYLLDVQVQRGSARQMSLDLSPELRVLEVEAPDMESWAIVPVASGNRVEVHWNDSFRGGRVSVRALAPLPSPSQPWTSPSVQVVGGLSRGEKLTILVHPDLEFEAWIPGGFQHLAGPAMSGQMRAIVLQSREVGPDVGKRPEAHIRVVAGTFQTRETWVWRIDAEQTSLAVDVQIVARQGSVFQFAWRVPIGWEVEQVESSSPNSDLRWSIASSAGSKPALLFIDLGKQSLPAETTDRRLTIRLRGPGIHWTSSPDGPTAALSVPQLRPDTDIIREGSLSVRLGPAVAQIAAGGRSLRSDQSTTFRGAPQGTIQVRQRRGRVQSRCDVDLLIGNDRRRATYKLQLKPATSAAEEFLLFVSAPVVFDSWRSLKGAAEARSLELLMSQPVSEAIWQIGSMHGWDFLGRRNVARFAAGSWWRLTLDRRLQAPTSFELTANLPPNAERIEVPLLTVAGAESFEGRVVVRSVPGESFRTEAIQALVDEVPAGSDGWARQAFIYGPTPFFLALTMSSQSEPGQMARVDEDTLVIQPTDDGRTLHRLHFRLSAWSGRELPVMMPTDSEIVSIRINGSDATASNLHDDQGSLMLPWNPARRSSVVDLMYATRRSPLAALDRLETQEPTLPVAMNPRRVWRLPSGVVPISLGEIRRIPGGLTLEDPSGSRARPSPTMNDLKIQHPHEAVVRAPSRAGESIEQWLSWGMGNPDEWSDWETNSINTISKIYVVRMWGLVIIGFVASAIPVLLIVTVQRGRRFVLAIELLAAGLGLIWLPSFLWGLSASALAIGLVLIAVEIAELFRRRAIVPSAANESKRSGVLVASLAIFAAIAVSGIAGPMEVAPVYLIPGSTPGMQTALVPPDLIESLRAMSRQGEPSALAVLLKSHYDGEVVGSFVRWSARFEAFRYADGLGPLTIALPDVQLLSSEVDRLSALPRINDEPGRFTFELVGRGSHTVVLKFQTPITGEVERDTRFAIPEAPISSCNVQLSPSSTDAQIIAARGAQRTSSAQSGPRLEVDLGRIGNMHLRWRQSSAAALPRPVVQAAHLWEITESSERLQSVFRFRFGPGGPKALEFDVPPELELSDVAPRQVDDPAGLSGPISIREWRRIEAAGRQRHHFEFQTPLTGQVQMELELLSRQLPGDKPALSFPELVGDFDCETTAAVRLQDLGTQLNEARGWERFGPDEFLHTIWQPLRVDIVDREPDLAFRRTHQPTPVLRLDLHLPESNSSGEQQINWLVGPGQVELQASARWSEPPFSGLLEWEVPASISITDVRGEGLRYWSRSGSRLQAWLDSRPSDHSANLTLTGVLPRIADESAQEKTPFVTPVLRQIGVRQQWTQLTVQAREGWRLEDQDVRLFQTFPTTDLPGVRWAGLTAATGPAAFTLHRAVAKLSGEILTFVESSNRALEWNAMIDAQLVGEFRTGMVQTIVVETRRLDGERPRISLPPGTRLRDSRFTLRGMIWEIDCLPGRHRIAVSGRLAAGRAQPVEVPHVSARGADDTGEGLRRWVALGPGVQALETAGLKSAPIPAGLDPRPESERSDAAGSVIQGDTWTMRVTESGTDARGSLPAPVLPETKTAQLSDGRRIVEAVPNREAKTLGSVALIMVLAFGLAATSRLDRRQADGTRVQREPA